MWVRLAHNFRVVDFYLWKLEGERSESHCHAMVFVCVDRSERRLAGFTIPDERIVILIANHITHLLQFRLQCFDTVGFLDLQTGKTGKLELDTKGAAGYDDGLS